MTKKQTSLVAPRPHVQRLRECGSLRTNRFIRKGKASARASRGWRRWSAVAFLFCLVPSTLAAILTTVPAMAAGDWGPDTCLEGFVWREAVPIDHTCVSGATRAQTAYDNSVAATRRSPTGGVYGPDTCLSGWVWREAVSGDHVCVTGATRTQASYDNTQTSARKNSLTTFYGTYTIPPRCVGDVCTSTSTDSIPRFRLTADHVNIGVAHVELRQLLSNALLATWSTYAWPAYYTPGGRVNLDTGRFDCQHSVDSYFRIQDPTSTRWSAPHGVSSICSVL